MTQRTTSLLMTLLLLCCGMCIPLHGQNKITMKTDKLIGESIRLEIKSVPGASLQFKGLEEDPSGGYKVAERTFSIIGDVTTIRFVNCGIKEVSFSPKHSTIREVWGNFNKITGSIDLSGAPELKAFVVTKNILSHINLSNCPKLETLYADRNALETVNIEGCNALKFVNVSDNQLKSLTFPSGATELTEILCRDNQIQGAAMKAMVKSLPDVNNASEYGTILLVNKDRTTEQNKVYKSDVAALRAKGYLCNALINGRVTQYEGEDDPEVPAQQISMTIGSDLVGQNKSLTIKGVGDITIDGVKEEYDPNRSSYTFTQQEVTIHGEVTDLTCSILGLTKLDLSQATSLTNLDCSYNSLTALDLSNTPKLKKLYCLNNQITQLSLNNLPNLADFNCSNNKITQLTAQDNAQLARCDIYLNSISEESMDAFIKALRTCDESTPGVLIVVDTKNSRLKEFNQITKETVELARSKNWEVYDWAAGAAVPISTTAMTDDVITLETGLAVGDKIALEISGTDKVLITGVLEPFEEFYKEYTIKDTKITIQGAVKVLVCGGQKIQKIDISKNPDLEYLHAYKNELTSFTIANHSNIKRLILSENKLSEVSVSDCSKLQSLSLWGNNLQSINLTNCPKITYVDCMRNNISDDAFQKLAKALPDMTESEEQAVIMLIDTKCSPKDKNVCLKSTVDKFLNKNWQVIDFGNEEFGREGRPFLGSDVAIEGVISSHLNIYPNPTADHVYVMGAVAETLVSLYSIDGQLLHQTQATATGEATIDMTALTAGTYILRVGTESQRIIKR